MNPNMIYSYTQFSLKTSNLYLLEYYFYKLFIYINHNKIQLLDIRLRHYIFFK